MASVSFEDEAVAEFFEAQVDAGRRPEQFGRIWLHTHPGDSPQPSMVDEETFDRVFGRCDWAVMFVLGRGGKTYARLRFNVGPGGEGVIPVEVDYGREFGPTDHEAWLEEYKANVQPESWSQTFGAGKHESLLQTFDTDRPGAFPKTFGADRELVAATQFLGADPEDWLDAFEEMDPADRRFVIDELAARPELWDESEVVPW